MKVFLLFNLLFVTALTPAISCKKVSVGLYYESLCPYSASFVVDSLATIFRDGLISIVDLELVPWGNAKIYGTQTIKCQVIHMIVIVSHYCRNIVWFYCWVLGFSELWFMKNWLFFIGFAAWLIWMLTELCGGVCNWCLARCGEYHSLSFYYPFLCNVRYLLWMLKCLFSSSNIFNITVNITY